jgi:glycosyltransferase involved in cell wall biosynthesis
LYDEHVCDNIDLVVTKSEWQKKNLLSSFPLLESQKTQVMYNGVDDAFVTEIPFRGEFKAPRFICASTVYRGLCLFSTIWPKIKAKIPGAKLDVFASTKLYDNKSKADDRYSSIFKDISNLSGVTLREPLPHDDFLKNLNNYYAMLYPNWGFYESSCGAALESMAYGVPVVASNRGGLTETLGLSDSGILVNIDFDDLVYFEGVFIPKVVYLWRNKTYRNSIARKGQEQILRSFRWEIVSKKWQKLLSEILLKKSNGYQESLLESLDDTRRTQDLHSHIETL